MKNYRKTLNIAVLTMMILSVLYIFITVVIFNVAQNTPTSASYQIEDTGYFVRYTTMKENGIYDDDGPAGKLLLEGQFGYDRGAAAQGNTLYCTEYRSSTLGWMTCDLVKVDLTTFEKKVLMKDAMLYGRCASGELIVMDGVVMANWFPQTNQLCELYRMTAGDKVFSERGAVVCLMDPESGEILWRKQDLNALTEKRMRYYMNNSLEEIAG